MNLISKLARSIQKKSQHKLTPQEWARLNVVVERYGALIIARCVNSMHYKRISKPIGYIEKMAQGYLISNVKPGEKSTILADILKEKDESRD